MRSLSGSVPSNNKLNDNYSSRHWHQFFNYIKIIIAIPAYFISCQKDNITSILCLSTRTHKINYTKILTKVCVMCELCHTDITKTIKRHTKTVPNPDMSFPFLYMYISYWSLILSIHILTLYITFFLACISNIIKNIIFFTQHNEIGDSKLPFLREGLAKNRDLKIIIELNMKMLLI